jgi:hypothetical protein
VTTGTISAASLTATVTVAPKTYDGTLSATVTACTLSGVVGGDDVHCTAGRRRLTARARATGAGDGERADAERGGGGQLYAGPTATTTGTITAGEPDGDGDGGAEAV